MNNTDQLFLAYHEAGHVIIALLNNCYVESCFIDGGCGLATYYQFNNQKSSRNKECQISFAGYLAELYLHQSLYETPFPAELKAGSRIDLAKIYYLVKRYNLNKQNIKINTSKKIAVYWNDIYLVANKLLSQRILSAKDIFNVLKRSKNKAFWKKKIKLLNKKYNRAS